MRRFFLLSAIVVTSLQGCAGKFSPMNGGDRASLQSLQLYAADSSPRFSAYLACTDASFSSCLTVENAFGRWSHGRHMPLRLFHDRESLLNAAAKVPSRKEADLPYRLAVHFVPTLMPSFDESGGPGGNMQSGYVPPKVNYRADVYVFDASNGKLLLKTHASDQRTTDPKADANTYLRAEAVALIDSLDPEYKGD